MPPHDDTLGAYPVLDMRPRDAARLAEAPHPPIAAVTYRPQARLDGVSNPLAPYRRA